MNYTLGHTKFKLRFIYKGGADHTFWVYSFAKENTTWEWNSCDDGNKPLLIGVDEIAAVYQVGYKRGLLGTK